MLFCVFDSKSFVYSLFFYNNNKETKGPQCEICLKTTKSVFVFFEACFSWCLLPWCFEPQVRIPNNQRNVHEVNGRRHHESPEIHPPAPELVKPHPWDAEVLNRDALNIRHKYKGSGVGDELNCNTSAKHERKLGRRDIRGQENETRHTAEDEA